MSVHDPLGPADVQGHGALQQAGEDLHLVGAAVLGDLEPLHQELRGEDNTPSGRAWLAHPEPAQPGGERLCAQGGLREAARG